MVLKNHYCLKAEVKHYCFKAVTCFLSRVICVILMTFVSSMCLKFYNCHQSLSANGRRREPFGSRRVFTFIIITVENLHSQRFHLSCRSRRSHLKTVARRWQGLWMSSLPPGCSNQPGPALVHSAGTDSSYWAWETETKRALPPSQLRIFWVRATIPWNQTRMQTWSLSASPQHKLPSPDRSDR